MKGRNKNEDAKKEETAETPKNHEESQDKTPADD